MAQLFRDYHNDYYIGYIVGTNNSKWYCLLKNVGIVNPYKMVVGANGRPLLWKTKKEVMAYAEKHGMYVVKTGWVYVMGGSGSF